MSEVFEEELLEKGSDCAGANTDEDVVDGNLGVVFFAVGIVEAGDAASGQVAKDVGVVWLPMSVVSFADNDGGDGVEGAGDDASVASVEVAGILMED